MRHRRGFTVLLATALILPMLGGCGPKKKKKEIRAEKGVAKLDESTEGDEGAGNNGSGNAGDSNGSS